MTPMTARPATPADTAAMTAIYNEGIEERIATFETRPRTPGEVAGWFDGIHPVVVVERAGVVVVERAGVVAGFAAAFTYRLRECCAGVAEVSVYVARASRGRGVGREATEALIAVAEAAGFWKLVSRVVPENTASRRLLRSTGFREVGLYRRHARLDGAWRDVVIVERLLGEAAS